MNELKTFSGRRASQNKFELESFADLLVKNGVTRYLEIGARDGDTFHHVMSSLPKGSYGLAVDLPGGLWGKSTTGLSLRAAVADLKEKGYDVHCILGNSVEPKTIAAVHKAGPFDAALIDGDHTLKGVTLDWNNYHRVAPIIAFHDIVGTGQYEKVHKNRVEVPILWSQIKATYSNTVEFVDTDSKMGIGVVVRG
jgi:hypothetical protein